MRKMPSAFVTAENRKFVSGCTRSIRTLGITEPLGSVTLPAIVLLRPGHIYTPSHLPCQLALALCQLVAHSWLIRHRMAKLAAVPPQLEGNRHENSFDSNHTLSKLFISHCIKVLRTISKVDGSFCEVDLP